MNKNLQIKIWSLALCGLFLWPQTASPQPCNGSQKGGEKIYLASFFPKSTPFSKLRFKKRMSRKRAAQKIQAENERLFQRFYQKNRKLITVIATIKSPDNSHPNGIDPKVLIYWQLGEAIFREKSIFSENPNYQIFLIKQVSRITDLTESKLHQIELFYRTYEIMASLSMELTWQHYELLIDITDNARRTRFQNQSVENNWTPRQLSNQIRQSQNGQ